MKKDRTEQVDGGPVPALEESGRSLETIARVARRTFTPLRTTPADQPSAVVERAVKFVLDHFSDDITLDDIARAVGLSKFYFLRRFRTETGITPKAFLLRYRMVRAMEWLIESDRSIGSIASEVGYRESDAFSRAFRNRTGTMPHLYRLTRMGRARGRPAFGQGLELSGVRSVSR